MKYCITQVTNQDCVVVTPRTSASGLWIETGMRRKTFEQQDFIK